MCRYAQFSKLDCSPNACNGRDSQAVLAGKGDVPFELVGQIASAGAMAKASDIERRSATPRHCVHWLELVGKIEVEAMAADVENLNGAYWKSRDMQLGLWR